MTAEIGGMIRKIEEEAEKILFEARDRAREIMEKANRQAVEISSAEPDTTDITTQRDKIIARAKADADELMEKAKAGASALKKDAASKIDETVKLILKNIKGA